MVKFNKAQKRVLLIALGIFVLLNFFPPWKTYTNPPEYTLSESLGYSFILSPPVSPFSYEAYVVMDYTRLFVQWAILILITAGVLLFFQKK